MDPPRIFASAVKEYLQNLKGIATVIFSWLGSIQDVSDWKAVRQRILLSLLRM